MPRMWGPGSTCSRGGSEQGKQDSERWFPALIMSQPTTLVTTALQLLCVLMVEHQPGRPLCCCNNIKTHAFGMGWRCSNELLLQV
jgi:hypothetical protein